MRALAVWLLLVPVAYADSKSKPKPAATPEARIEALVRANLAAAAARDNSEFGVTDTAVIYLTMGNKPTIDDTQRLSDNFYADLQATVTHTVDKVIVSVDTARGIAWFQAPYKVTMSGDHGNGVETFT